MRTLPIMALRRVIELDQALLREVSSWQRPWLTRVLQRITRLGDPEVFVLLGLGLLAAGAPSPRRLAARLAMGVGGAALLAQAVKRLSRRRRPSEGLEGFSALVANPDAYSFPSGHTAAAVGLAVAWAGEGAGMGSAGAAFASLMGFSRVYLGAHFPLDVAAGAALGVLSGMLARLAVL